MNTLFQKMRNNRQKAAIRQEKARTELSAIFSGFDQRIEAAKKALAAARAFREQVQQNNPYSEWSESTVHRSESTQHRWYRNSAWFNKGDKT